MAGESSFLVRHQLTAYFALTFLISWAAILASFGLDGLPANPDQAHALGMALLLGPCGASLILTALVRGRAGFRELWTRLKRWRIGGRYYALALLAAPISALLTLLVLSAFDAQFTPKVLTAADKGGLLLTGLGAGLFIALFEELGWTGFAVPRLLERHGVLFSGAVTGLLWGLWHFPPFWQADSFSAGLPLLLLLARLFSWIVAFRVLMVWLYRRTESLLAVILMHASLVVCMIALEPPLDGSALLTYILSWTAVLWAVVAIGGLALGRVGPRAANLSAEQ
ncbi:MAG: CPBP family intramembrane metalloprotease [Deltaproteobacteria bacterium]|nr:MAG: CPBP family intramembrane metalloprotease [Deltaproteobacteria bacterium]